MTLTVGSLFSGIGGLDLGLERAGMKVIWQSEIDPYASRVLKKHWPEVPNHGDIKRIQWGDIVRPDVICGGYPCQPFSTAGARKGEEDPRHLWPWVRHALSVLRPRYAILENVRGHLSLGGTAVLREIAALGYCAEWRIVSAASVGANHRRDRVIIVAYPNGGHAPDGRQRQALPSEDRSRRNDRRGSDADPREVTVRGSGEDPRHVADTDDSGNRASRRDYQREGSTNCQEWGNESFGGPGRRGAVLADSDGRRLEERQPETESIRLTGGTSERSREVFAGDIGEWRGWEWWETEPDVGRVAHGIPNRVDRLKGLGNAVVPQVAEIIGRLVLNHYETVTA